MKPPYRIAELESWVRGVEEAMISATDRAATAERERDELRKLSVTRIILDITPGENGMGHEIHAKSVSEVESLISSLYERLEAAEAEIARRDAEAGEPVAWQFQSDGGKWLDIHDPEDALRYGYKVRELYTAAPPVVLPPLKKITASVPTDWHRGVVYGWNCCIEMALKLGAQPQKPVSLVGDAIVYEHVNNGLAQYGTLPNGARVTAQFAAGFNYRGEIDKSALDAANVKWEMNK